MTNKFCRTHWKVKVIGVLTPIGHLQMYYYILTTRLNGGEIEIHDSYDKLTSESLL
jgi:hypothetical protein